MGEIKTWFCQECLVVMEYNKEFNYFKCPKCEAEVWLKDYDKDKEAKKVAEELSDVIIPVNKKGGGSKGRSRKQLMKKKTTKQLYEEL